MTNACAKEVLEGMTPEQLKVLRHMLGIDLPYEPHPKPYRNYCCATPGDPQLHELQRIGAVRLYLVAGGYEWFTCTDVGRNAAFQSHKTILAPRKKRIYAKFLDVRDAFSDLTFKEFLTSEHFKDSRESA